MRLPLRLRDADLIHNNQYLQHYSDTCEQSSKRSMIFLLPRSSDKNQPTHAFKGARQGEEMVFSFFPVHVHPSSFVAQHSQVLHKVTSPLPVLLMWLWRNRHKT